MGEMKKRDDRNAFLPSLKAESSGAQFNANAFRAAVLAMRCAKCKRLVDRVEIMTPMYDLVGTRVAVNVNCHGAHELVELIGEEVWMIADGKIQVREAFEGWDRALPAPPAEVKAEIVPAPQPPAPWTEKTHPGKCPNCNKVAGKHGHSQNHLLPVCPGMAGVWPDRRDPHTGQLHRPSERWDLLRNPFRAQSKENIHPRCVHCKGFMQEHLRCVSVCGTIIVLVCQNKGTLEVLGTLWRPDNV